MTISPEKVWFDEDNLWVLLSDGRTVGAPLAWFPRLLPGLILSLPLHWPVSTVCLWLRS